MSTSNKGSASSEQSKDPFAPQLAACLKEVARDVGGLAVAELWSQSDIRSSSLLQLKAQWVAQSATMASVPPESLELLQKPAPPCSPGVGLAGSLFTAVGATFSWRKLEHIADCPELPQDDHTAAIAAAFPGAMAAGILSKDHTCMLLLITLPQHESDSVEPPCMKATAVPLYNAALQALQSMLNLQQLREVHLKDRRAVAHHAWVKLRTVVKTGLLVDHHKHFEASHPNGEHSHTLETLKAAISNSLHNMEAHLHFRHRSKEQAKPREPFPQQVQKYFKKWKGVGAKPSPRDLTSKSLFVLVGVFLSLIALSAISTKIVVEETDREYTMFLGSMGALSTLLYCVPNSPLTQPRNVVLGHLIAGAVGALVNEFTVENDESGGIPRWVSQALSPAIAISLLGRLGLTHPPAGAVSVIAVSSKVMIELKWKSLLCPLLPMSCFAVVAAMIINNFSDKRQYPMVW